MAANIQNLKPCKPGETHNPNGRPRKLSKALKKIPPDAQQKIYAILFQKKISKGQRLSNWEADVLTSSQQKYAALDAWACLQIYKQLNNQA